jgi:hypothetical protein
MYPPFIDEMEQMIHCFLLYGIEPLRKWRLHRFGGKKQLMDGLRMTKRHELGYEDTSRPDRFPVQLDNGW